MEIAHIVKIFTITLMIALIGQSFIQAAVVIC